METVLLENILTHNIIYFSTMYRFQHLPKVCMNYSTHFLFSMRLSILFLQGSIGAFIHAIHPDIYCKSSTTISHQIEKHLKSGGCNKDPPNESQ